MISDDYCQAYPWMFDSLFDDSHDIIELNWIISTHDN